MAVGGVSFRVSLAALALLVAGCRPEPHTIEKILLTRLPRTYIPETLVLSEDGAAWAFVENADGGERVVTAAGPGPAHRKCVGLGFAPKTHRLFYWTSDGSGTDTRIGFVADGTPYPTDFLATGQYGFSADGSRWFVAGAAPPPSEEERLGDITILVDGVVAARGRDLAMPAFSPDGRHVAHLENTDAGTRLVVDGVERRVFEPPARPCGIGSKAAAPHPDLPLRHFTRYLPDGSLLTVTRDADGWGVYVDARRIASYPRSYLDSAPDECQTATSFSPRSLRTAERAPVAAWWERLEGPDARWRVVRNGEPADDRTCVDSWRRHPPEPTPDGARVIYPCLETDPSGVTRVVVANGTATYGPYDDVFAPALSANGAHVAYGATVDTSPRPWTIEVDGVMRAGPFASVWRPRVSDDGTAVAWQAVVRPDERGVLGLGARPLVAFDEVFWGPEFDGADHVAWIIRRGRALTRIRVPLALATDPERPHRVVRR